jgi:hypothetical protein
MTRADEALAYAARGWPVFPCGWAGSRRWKLPLTTHGHLDATINRPIIAAWWRRLPEALIATPTGRDFVVLDVDTRNGGFETLAGLGFAKLPATLTSVTGGGGRHFYFQPVEGLRNTQGSRGRGIGRGLDWRGEGGYVVLPASGCGYSWFLDAPLAAVPAALLPRPENRVEIIGTAAQTTVLTEYGEAALRSAAGNILNAPNGEQEATLNHESYKIGRAAGAGMVPVDLALNVLLTAARGLPNYDPQRPWRRGQAEAKVRREFNKGLAKPRPTLPELEREWARIEAEAGDAWA